MPGGQPTKYTEEKATKICSLIAEGKSVRAIAKLKDQPSEATIYNWLVAHPEFLEKYTRAREQQAEVYAQEIIDIADDSTGDMTVDPETGAERLNSEHVQRSKLRIDARKWAASKLQPKKYGDRTAIDVGMQGDTAALLGEMSALFGIEESAEE